ncbi:MAG: crossover junction endodeoxyribonuclease RuvC [Leucobacter sp.]
MRVIGIDPGLTRLGVGVVSSAGSRKLTFEHVEVLTSPAGAELPARLHQLGSALERLLDGDRPDAIAIERVFAQQNLPSVMGVAQISGIVMYLAQERGIPVAMYTPNEVKASVTGYGAADKAQVTNMVTRLLGLAAPPKPADAADALALAIVHAWHLGRGGAPDRQRASVAPAGETPAQRAWREAEAKGGRRRSGPRA